MGIYTRKAISVGPFRFNLSKSGVGISVGVKGFRVGMGPRGNYVHMGRGGLYYGKSLPSGFDYVPHNPEDQQSEVNIEHESLKEIDSAHITQYG